MWWSIASSSSPCECVCYHQSSMCNCVTRKSPESRSIGVSSPLFKVQCCQRSRRCQHGTLSHHRTSWWNPRMVVRHPSKPCFGASKKKTLTTLNFAMVTSEKPVLPTVSEKHQLAWWARTRARVFVCGSKISVSFISLSFIMMIANLNLNAAAMVAPRGGQFYY